MAIFKCKMCGGDLNLQEGVSVAECEYCGSVQTVPSADNEKKMTLFSRANRLRAGCEFDKAAGVYETIVADFPEEAEAYWGLVLCKYGIEYVDDPATGNKIPTCHRSSFESIMDDSDLEQALENADLLARKQYRDEAKQIEEIRKGIIAVSANEQPYDIFICYKETDANGDRTLDSVLAQDIYDALTAKNYRVFFSRITLEDKLGVEFEPYIFAALNSAKIMLAVGTDYEYYNAVWVKNEWSRYLKLMAKDKGKHLIPCFKGIDAYDMPKEFARLQAQDLGKVGAIQDLLRGIEKILPKNQPVTVVQEKVVSAENITVAPLLKRAFMFLEDGEWNSANEYCEKVLDVDPENSMAYLGKVMVALKCSYADQIAAKLVNLDSMKDFVRAVRFAKGETLDNLQKIQENSRRMLLSSQLVVGVKKLYNKRVKEEETRIKKENIYTEAKLLMQGADTEQEYRKASKMFATISSYQDCAELASQCEQMAEARKLYEDGEARRFANYQALLNIAKSSSDISELKDIAEQFQSLDDYRDSRDLAQYCLARAKEEQDKQDKLDAEAAHQTEIARAEYVAAKTKLANAQAQLKQQEAVYAENKLNILGKGAKLKKAAGTEIVNLKNEIRELEYQVASSKANVLMATQQHFKAYKAFIALNGYKDSSERAKAISRECPDSIEIQRYTAKVGESVYFGSYEQNNDISNGKENIEWLVLEKTGNKILVISKYALDCQPYHRIRTSVTWETCTLRTWLNSTFLNTAFTASEQAMIPMITVSADINPKYRTNPGKATQDKVFLLSITEVNKYFSSGSARECKPTYYTAAKCANGKHGNGNCFWWLRSPGMYRDCAAYVDDVDGVGCVFECGDYVNRGCSAVRPALWIDLDA